MNLDKFSESDDFLEMLLKIEDTAILAFDQINEIPHGERRWTPEEQEKYDNRFLPAFMAKVLATLLVRNFKSNINLKELK